MPSPALRLPASRSTAPTRRGRAALLWLVLASTMSACATWEEQELRQDRDELGRRLAQLMERAQNLERHHREEKELEARMEVHCAPQTVEELSIQALASTSAAEVSVREQRGRAVWLLVEGKGPSASMVKGLDGLARQAPYFSLEEAVAKEERWTLVLRSARPCPLPRLLPSPLPRASAPRPSPPPPENRLLQSEEGVRLRQDMAETEERLEQVLKVLGDNLNLRERVDEMRSTVEQAERDNDRSEDGVRRRLPLVHALFDVPGSGPGALRTLRHELFYEGVLALEEEPWNARLDAAGFRVARREGGRRVLVPD